MSEEIKIGSCPACGAELTEGARFCSICGTPVSVEGQKNTVNEAQMPVLDDSWTDDESDGNVKGKKKRRKQKKTREAKNPLSNVSAETLYAKELSAEKVSDSPDLQKSATVTKAKFNFGDVLSAISSKELINRIVVFVIAAALLALAFAPFAFSAANVGLDDTVNIGFSPKDNVELGVRSLYFLEEAELRKTDLYTELQDASLVAELMRSSTMKKDLFLKVMSSHVEPRVTVLFAALTSVVYIALCVIFLIFAFIDLLRELITLKRKKGSEHICSRFSDTLFLAFLCLLPFFVFIFTQSCDMGVGGVWAAYTGAGVGLAWGGILTVLVAILGAVFVISKNTISLVSLKEKYFSAARIKNIVCCGLILLVIVSAFMPCITLKLSNIEGTDKAVVSVDFNEIKEQSSDDIYELAKTSSDAAGYEFENQINEVLDDFIFHKSGTAKIMLDTLLIKINRIDTRVLYTAVSIITAFTIVFACLFLFALSIKVFQRAKSGLFVKLFRILTILFAIVDLIMAIILAVSVYNVTVGVLAIMVTPTIGFGAVLMVVSAVATAFFRVDPKRVKLIDKGYDNADVSYAPYVLDR